MVSPESWVLFHLFPSIIYEFLRVFEQLFHLILFRKLFIFNGIDAKGDCVEEWVLFDGNHFSILVDNFFGIEFWNNLFLINFDILVLSLSIDRSCSFYSCHVGHPRLTSKSIRNLRSNNLVACNHGHIIRSRSTWILLRSQSLERIRSIRYWSHLYAGKWCAVSSWHGQSRGWSHHFGSNSERSFI